MMEMHFFWVVNQVEIGKYTVTWHPGKENLAHYFTKQFDATHHQEVQPWYLHSNSSPTELPHALAHHGH